MNKNTAKPTDPIWDSRNDDEPAPPAFSVDDAINGLKHMADDHKCCGPFISAAILKLEQLQDATRIALWIRDRLRERGSFGSEFEEWGDIEKATK